MILYLATVNPNYWIQGSLTHNSTGGHYRKMWTIRMQMLDWSEQQNTRQDQHLEALMRILLPIEKAYYLCLDFPMKLIRPTSASALIFLDKNKSHLVTNLTLIRLPCEVKLPRFSPRDASPNLTTTNTATHSPPIRS